MNSLDSRRTALVLIDLMPRIIALDTAPFTGQEVLDRSVALAKATRSAGGLVVNVRVERPGLDVQPEGSEFAPAVAPQPGDLEIVKNTIGAFGRTTLDAELQSRGITHLALAGIATNFGVESTARAASDLGYELIFITDAMTGLDEPSHTFALTQIFPRLGTLTTTTNYTTSLT
ncbi:isochorismatase family protein [Kribbella sp. NPDC026611]|uniref:isochorismatase family protein n=1 Tax=Kribbella sp. NPDC026611 TaxID=3154911 RepID=UPI0033EF7D23